MEWVDILLSGVVQSRVSVGGRIWNGANHVTEGEDLFLEHKKHEL